MDYVSTVPHGVQIPIASLAQTMTYNVDKTINKIEVTYNLRVYRQTFTWSDGVCTVTSAWTDVGAAP